MNDTNLAALLSSRICHDLVSPVGAIVNGVDLVKEFAPADWSDEIGMINQSAERASDLLQFYRVAFGAAAASDEAMSRASLRDKAMRMISSPRIALDWAEDGGPALPRPEARLICLLLMCAKSVVGMRGTLALTLPPAATLPLKVSILGDGVDAHRAMLDVLTGTNDEAPTARLVEFSLAVTAAQELRLRLTVSVDPGSAVISLDTA